MDMGAHLRRRHRPTVRQGPAASARPARALVSLMSGVCPPCADSVGKRRVPSRSLPGADARRRVSGCSRTSGSSLRDAAWACSFSGSATASCSASPRRTPGSRRRPHRPSPTSAEAAVEAGLDGPGDGQARQPSVAAVNLVPTDRHIALESRTYGWQRSDPLRGTFLALVNLPAGGDGGGGAQPSSAAEPGLRAVARRLRRRPRGREPRGAARLHVRRHRGAPAPSHSAAPRGPPDDPGRAAPSGVGAPGRGGGALLASALRAPTPTCGRWATTSTPAGYLTPGRIP